MNLDWGRLRAVVFQSDDWGLCAWVPDEQAHRSLMDSPAWREPPGRVYGRSTLESAQDVARLVETLLEFRGQDGLPPVWQANTVMAAPDYDRLEPPLFEVEELPLVSLPRTPSRWSRPGLWDRVKEARERGVWWPELHGLHHLPAAAWLDALRRGEEDARRAHLHQSPICEAVQRSAEYDPSEPASRRVRDLERSVKRFEELFGRAPRSLCPPDYRWDEALEEDAERLGVAVLQGKGEQRGPLLALRRVRRKLLWPGGRRGLLYMPPRIAFEPRGDGGPAAPLGARRAHRAARAAWARGQPAAVSTHRVNYAHLDPAWSEAGRAALRDLLAKLQADGAIFLTDAEAGSLVGRGWSARPLGTRGALVRLYGAPRETVRFRGPPGIAGVRVLQGSPAARVALEGATVVAELGHGECLLEWIPG